MSPDLISIVFPFNASSSTSLPLDNGRIMQGAFLNWLQQGLPELAVKLHDQYQRFYTVSSFQGDFKNVERWLQIRAGQSAWFRVTVMHGEIANALLEYTAGQEVGPFFEDAVLKPQQPIVTENGHPFVRITSFGKLAESVEASMAGNALRPEVVLRFLSPTCFMENDHSLPLPIPTYVFGYLFNQWQMSSPQPLPVEDVDSFIHSIHLGYASIKTQFVDLVKFRRIGFTGLTRFGLHPKLPGLYRILLHLLAEFSFFSGIGSHTAMGMGQVLPQDTSR
jgi:CRISPR-associated endoribonuclease Cas6